VVGAGENHAIYAREVIRLVEMVKRVDPGIFTVLGGAHFTNLPEMYLPKAPSTSSFAERARSRFASWCGRWRAAGGPRRRRRTASRSCGRRGRRHEARALIDDLDSLPMPALDLMPMSKYGQAKLLFSPGAPASTTAAGAARRARSASGGRRWASAAAARTARL